MRTVVFALFLPLAISCAGDNTGNASPVKVDRLYVLDGEEIAGQGDNPVVLEWAETHTNFSRFARTLTVRANREARYRRVGEGAVERVFEISEAQWSAFSEELTNLGPCELVSQGEGEHEDQRPRLTVAENGMRCRVDLWDAEWFDGAAARVRTHVQSLFPAE